MFSHFNSHARTPLQHRPPRDLDPHQPIDLCGDRYLQVIEPRVRHEWEWEDIYIVEMELVESPSSNHFDVAVAIYWEQLADTTGLDIPPVLTLFGIARNCVRDHFNDSPAPRLLAQRFGVELQFPPREDLPTY